MRVRRALITAAAPDQHTLPLQQLVDRHGESKTALQLIVEEVVRAGVEEICVVIQPGDQDEYRRAAGPEVERLLFVEQPRPRGYGHALLQARDFVGRDPFLHLVGDHLYLSQHDRCCAQQLMEAFAKHGCSVSAVQATRETKLPYFGAVGGQLIPGETNLYEVTKVLEKPTPTLAEQELIIAGLRAGYYLCFFGMHVLTSRILDILADMEALTSIEPLSVAEGPDGPAPLQFSSALARLAQQEKYLALELDGARYNIGVKYGLLMAQLALALQGNDRDAILTELVELLATGALSRT